MKKTLLVGCSTFLMALSLYAQNIDKTYQSYFLHTSNDYSRYNAITLGSQVGKSINSTDKSFVFYNFNQFAITDRLYASTYAEYYKDDKIVSSQINNYFNAQVFMNFKVQPKFVMGLGLRHNDNIESNITQNYIQLKVEKTFAW